MPTFRTRSRRSGKRYLEADRNNDFWRRLPESAGLVINLNGDLREGMEMECWAVWN
jgi:predicted component of type VI protein secretion system